MIRSICIHDPEADTIRFNPLWLDYARAQGRTPAAQAMHDGVSQEGVDYLAPFHQWLDRQPVQQSLFEASP